MALNIFFGQVFPNEIHHLLMMALIRLIFLVTSLLVIDLWIIWLNARQILRIAYINGMMILLIELATLVMSLNI